MVEQPTGNNDADCPITCKNQSVENAGVAFVKGANEQMNSLEKIKKTVLYDERVRTNKAKD